MALKQAAAQLGQHPGNMLRAAVAGQQLGNQRRNAQIDGAMNALGMLLGAWQQQSNRKRQAKRDEVKDQQWQAQFDQQKEYQNHKMALDLMEHGRQEKWTDAQIKATATKLGIENEYLDLAKAKDAREGALDELSIDFLKKRHPFDLRLLGAQADLAEGEVGRAGERHTADMLGAHASRQFKDAQTGLVEQQAMSAAQDRDQSAQLFPSRLETASMDPRLAAAQIENLEARTRQMDEQTAQIGKSHALAMREIGIAEGDANLRFQEHVARQEDRKGQRAYMAAQIDNLNANTTLTEARAVQLDNAVQFQLNTAQAETMGDLFTSLEDREKHLENMVGKLFGTDSPGPWATNDVGRDEFRAKLQAELAAVKTARQKLRSGEWDGKALALVKAELGQILNPEQFGATEEKVFGE